MKRCIECRKLTEQGIPASQQGNSVGGTVFGTRFNKPRIVCAGCAPKRLAYLRTGTSPVDIEYANWFERQIEKFKATQHTCNQPILTVRELLGVLSGGVLVIKEKANESNNQTEPSRC